MADTPIDLDRFPAWELSFGDVNCVATLVRADRSQVLDDPFDTNGKALNWSSMPRVQLARDPRRRRAKPRVDISFLTVGALVLNRAAYLGLGTFLLPFGQLLEISCEGMIEYFYNVTCVIDCLDEQAFKSGRDEFRAGAVPTRPVIFKDPRTAGASIYATAAACRELHQLLHQHGLTGLTLVAPGHFGE